jgi:hypothetical protein
LILPSFFLKGSRSQISCFGFPNRHSAGPRGALRSEEF